MSEPVKISAVGIKFVFFVVDEFQCTVSCGGGTKMRNVVCLDNKNKISTRCEGRDRPAFSSPCNTNPCPDQIKWKYGDWSAVRIIVLTTPLWAFGG